MNIGFFGGSFDPIHKGHISLASAAADRYELRQVLFVTANVPPHKQTHAVTAFAHRYAMVALATQDEKRFVPSLLESAEETRSNGQPAALVPRAKVGQGRAAATRGAAAKPLPAELGVNYTIDTVRRLKATLKKADRLILLIGIDAFRDIAKWREARALLAECEFVVASRPGYSLRDVAEALPDELRPAAAVTKPFHKQPATGDLVLPGLRLHLLEGVHQNISATAIREAAAQGKALTRWVDPRVGEYIRKMGLYKS
ncbi:MAG: nicotinate-nucleotide adenylyltransferase [Terriglobales bacterium]